MEHTKTIMPFHSRSSALNQTLLPYTDYLIQNSHSKQLQNELMIKSCLFAIMHHINQNCLPSDLIDLKQTLTYEKIKLVLAYIKEHYDDTITIKQASAICGFSTSHFMKLFKDVTALSFSQYLISYRLELAAEKLRSSDDKIITIAGDFGFHNLSYFTRAFSQKYGVTPSAYRK